MSTDATHEEIRRDQEEQARKQLRELIEEGPASGPGRRMTTDVAAQLKKRALDAGRWNLE